MARKPRSKKSEALEIRVSHEEKQAFMDAVSTRGTTASTVLRDAMALFVRNGRLRRHNIMITSALIATTAAAIIFQTMPEGETQPYHGVNQFNAMDANFDRAVTFEEYREHLGSARARLSPGASPGEAAFTYGALFALYGDAVPDGFISRAENDPDSIAPACWQAIEARWSGDAVRWFNAIDVDGDGRLTAREFSNRHTALRRTMFDAQDADGNGVLDLDELMVRGDGLSHTTEWPDHITTCFGDSPTIVARSFSEPDNQRSAEEMLQYYDLDGDGVISWDEYLSFPG